MPATVRRIVLLGVLGALLVIAQVALAFLPNIELVSLLIIVCTLALGSSVFAPISVFVLVEGLLYGFGLWWLNYLYVWPILAGIVLLLRKQRSPIFWAIFSGGFGLFFGALCAIPYFFIGGPASAFAYWVSGLPFDIAHCAGNVAAELLLFTPCLKILERLVHFSANTQPQ